MFTGQITHSLRSILLNSVDATIKVEEDIELPDDDEEEGNEDNAEEDDSESK